MFCERCNYRIYDAAVWDDLVISSSHNLERTFFDRGKLCQTFGQRSFICSVWRIQSRIV